MSTLTCQYIYNSALGDRVSVPSSGFAVDLAENPQAAHQLIKLGISPRKDLPAVLVTDAAGKLRLIGLRLSPEEAELVVRGRWLPGAELVLYHALWCPDCKRVKQTLAEAGLAYDEVDLDTDRTAEALVLAKSGGRRVVPTLRFDQRVFVFNPDHFLLRRLVDSVAAVGA